MRRWSGLYLVHTNMSHQFLERDPSRRLGCKPHGEGFAELRQHPWFQSTDWETLEDKTQTPPFVPDVSTLTEMASWHPAD